MSSVSKIQFLYNEYLELIEDLKDSPSSLSIVNRTFHKHLLIAAASSLESKVKKDLSAIFMDRGSQQLEKFFQRNILKRGYHALFEWNAKANSFFNGFGDDSGVEFKRRMKDDLVFSVNHDCFMELGFRRNILVHNDYALAQVDLTPNEIIEKYTCASKFVDEFESIIFVEVSDGEV